MDYSDILGKKIVDIDSAECLGKVKNLEINLQTLKIANFISIDNTVVSAKNIISCKNDIILLKKNDDIESMQVLSPIGVEIINNKGKILGIVSNYQFDKNFYLKYIVTDNKKMSAQKIKSMSLDVILLKEKASFEIEIEENLIPNIISDYSFLLGRKVVANILSKDRKLIIKQGAVITSDIVMVAKNTNKLVQLTIYSR